VYPPHGHGTVPIMIDAKYPTSGGSFLGPPKLMASIGGHVVELQPGPNRIDMPPGVWPVEVWYGYARSNSRWSRASTTVDTTNGQPATLYYAPSFGFGSGALDHQPVGRPGCFSFVVLLVALCGLTVGIGHAAPFIS